MANAGDVIREFLAQGGNPQAVGEIALMTGNTTGYANTTAQDYVNKLKAGPTPEQLAQRRQDESVWTNMYMNSPSYNPGGANSYLIQQGNPNQNQNYLFQNSVNQNASNTQQQTPQTNTSTTNTGLGLSGEPRQQTQATINTNPVTSIGSLNNQNRSNLSDSGAPVYDGSFSLARQQANNQRMGTEGYLGQLSKSQTQTRGNPYNNIYPWSNWKLWSN